MSVRGVVKSGTLIFQVQARINQFAQHKLTRVILEDNNY